MRQDKSYICPTDMRSTTNTENVSHSMHPSYHLPVLWFSDRNIRAVKEENTLTTIHEQNQQKNIMRIEL
jgi:hypothetical protein